MSRIHLLVLALLLAAPPAMVANASDPVRVTIATPHAGDRMSYVEHTVEMDVDWMGDRFEATFIPTTHEHVVLLEGRSTAADKFGIERATEVYRHDRSSDGELDRADECHQVPGGNASVVTERLLPFEVGSYWARGSMELGPLTLSNSSSEGHTWETVDYGGASCWGWWSAFAGRTFVEGERIAMRELEGARVGPVDQMSEPLEATTFHGRPALWARFPHGESDGENSVLLVDGLPGVANATLDMSTGWDGETHRYKHTFELVGYAAGSGPALAPYTGEAYDRDNPTGVFQPPDRLAFDDSAFHLAFTYAEAYAQLYADPTSGLKAWVDAHPDALIAMATYDAPSDDSMPGVRPDATWTLIFSEADESFAASASASSAFVGPAKLPLVPFGPFANSGSSWSGAWPAALPEHVATSHELASLLDEHGLAVDRIAQLSYLTYDNGKFGPMAILSATDVVCCGEETTGREITLDAAHDGLHSIATVETTMERSGLLEPAAAPSGGLDRDRDGLGALSALVGPVGGLGVVAGAAGGVALLVLVLKFVLLPLFTRIARARVLDNPTRSRLYERVRADPGIHLAELEDYGGVGKGATAHHVDKLARHGLVFRVEEAGRVRLFAAGEVPVDVARRAALLRAGSHARVYEVYAQRPDASLREAARELGMSAPSVHRAKKKLEGAGLLPARVEGRVVLSSDVTAKP